MRNSRNEEEFEHRCVLSWLCRLTTLRSSDRCVLCWVCSRLLLSVAELSSASQQATKQHWVAEMQVMTYRSRAVPVASIGARRAVLNILLGIC